MAKLKDWLKQEKTDPQLAEAILAGLQGWYSGEANHSTSRRPAFLQQSELGWDTFLEGRLSALWRQEQDEFWQRIKSRKSSKRWTSELIKKLWEVSWDLWTHRNMELHSSEEARTLILEADINRRIVEAFLHGSSGLPRDAVHLLNQTKEQVLQWPLTTKQQWLDSLAAAKRRAERANRDPLAGERELMERWVIHP